MVIALVPVLIAGLAVHEPPLPPQPAQPLTRERGLLLLSTDGGTTGGEGAAYFASHSSLARRVVAAIVLDSVAAPSGSAIRVLIRPDTPRGTSPTVFRTVRSTVGIATG